MKINGNTKVSKVIKENKEAIEAIVSLNPHFTKLRNPVLRRLLAPRVNLAEAAKIGKCDVEEMLNALVAIGFELEDDLTTEKPKNKPLENEQKERFLENKKIISLDVRPILAKGEDPFNSLQKALKKLGKEEVLEILIDFEPIPLIRIQEKKGYVTLTVAEDGVYHTYFKAAATNTSATPLNDIAIQTVSQPEYDELVKTFPGKIVTIDVRDLEMPGPLVKILEAIEKLDDNTGLKIFHKRIPQHLLPELETKKLSTFICPISEGNVMLFITRNNVQSRNK